MSSTPEVLLPVAAGALAVGITGLCLAAYALWDGEQQLNKRVARVVGSPRDMGKREREDSGPARLSRLAEASKDPTDFEFARMLDALRLPPEAARTLVLSLRLLLGACGALALLWVGSGVPLLSNPVLLAVIGALGGGLGWRLPQFVAKRMTVHRTRAIAQALPEAIELLVIAVEAGLSLEDALQRIVTELRHTEPAIAKELALTSADLKILPDRDEALHRLSERVDLPSLHSVVTTLVQTLRYGTPLAKALRVVAAELRNDSLLRLEEQANRLPVLLTVPMILFILPSLLMVIGGPAFLHVLDVLER